MDKNKTDNGDERRMQHNEEGVAQLCAFISTVERHIAPHIITTGSTEPGQVATAPASDFIIMLVPQPIKEKRQIIWAFV